MSKTIVQRKPPAPVAQDELDQVLASFARKQFLGAAVNMGWQLALTVIIPVFIGVKLDDHFHSTPSYTLAALFLAVGCATVVVWNIIKQVNLESVAGSPTVKNDNSSTNVGVNPSTSLRVKEKNK